MFQPFLHLRIIEIAMMMINQSPDTIVFYVFHVATQHRKGKLKSITRAKPPRMMGWMTSNIVTDL